MRGIVALQDSLTPVAESMAVILDADHAVNRELQRLAQANMSESVRRQRLELQRLREVRLHPHPPHKCAAGMVMCHDTHQKAQIQQLRSLMCYLMP